MQCPHCGTALFEGRLRTARMHGCGACGGLWLDNEASRRLFDRFDVDAVELANRASLNAAIPFPTLAATPACPSCAAPMRALHIDAVTVDVDVCDAHGTWFDRDELQAVATHVGKKTAPRARPPEWMDAPAEPVGGFEFGADPSVPTDDSAAAAYAQGALVVLELAAAILSSSDD